MTKLAMKREEDDVDIPAVATERHGAEKWSTSLPVWDMLWAWGTYGGSHTCVIGMVGVCIHKFN